MLEQMETDRVLPEPNQEAFLLYRRLAAQQLAQLPDPAREALIEYPAR